MRMLLRCLSMSALAAALILSNASCNNQSGFSGSVGNTPNGPRLASYEILGTVGTPFTATVSDSRSSWTLQGNVPLSIVIANNILPAAVIATKTTSNSNLLSIEIIAGNRVAQLQSTNAPFGTVSVQVAGTINTIPTRATPDLRIFLTGPLNLSYSALVEDIDTGFVIDGRAPTLILFDTPNGKVDATFFGPNDHTTFTADMTLDGQVVVPTESEGPNLTIREP
ncbi:MAG TPA: hypothetical protein VGR40_06240 [Candidatus Binatus sp.]|nr:hypothetical protein [Candidatus Binatus sp.]